MKLKNTIISCFLIVVLAIQMLPVKQVVKYFLVDYPMSEELVETHKSFAKNLRLLDEDHKLLHEWDHISPDFIIIDNIALFDYSESLPDLHAADITTPPPNFS